MTDTATILDRIRDTFSGLDPGSTRLVTDTYLLQLILDEEGPEALIQAVLDAARSAGDLMIRDHGFVWLGQPFTSCDRCGQPAWEHTGIDVPDPDLFSDAPGGVRPWLPGEADAIRRKWEPSEADT